MKHKEKILELRSKGYSYGQIQKELGCSKATISFHCGENQKDKHSQRQLKFRKTNPISDKLSKFLTPRKKYKTILSKRYTNIAKILGKKIIQFHQTRKFKQERISFTMSFTVKELMSKIGDNPKCALTGKPIDLTKPRTYHLDHIIPASKGGKSTLDNCQILLKEVNEAKRDMLQEDFIQMCENVVKYHQLNKQKKQ